MILILSACVSGFLVGWLFGKWRHKRNLDAIYAQIERVLDENKALRAEHRALTADEFVERERMRRARERGTNKPRLVR